MLQRPIIVNGNFCLVNLIEVLQLSDIPQHVPTVPVLWLFLHQATISNTHILYCSSAGKESSKIASEVKNCLGFFYFKLPNRQSIV